MTAGPPPPQRVPAEPDEASASMDEVIALLEKMIARASTFSEDARNRRVDDEWSTIESIRHMVFVIDIWLGKMIRRQDDPFHPIGLPPHFLPAKPEGSSIDPQAHPGFDEACEVLMGRIGTLDAFVASLSPGELQRPIGTHAGTVAGGLGVVFDELTYHAGFVNRDLDKIEGTR